MHSLSVFHVHKVERQDRNMPELYNEDAIEELVEQLALFEPEEKRVEPAVLIPASEITGKPLRFGELQVSSPSISLIHTLKGARSMRQFFVEFILRFYQEGIVFIDCANIFPAYEIVQAAMDRGILDPEEPLQKVMMARCFNYFQVTQLITELLEEELKKGTRIVVISGISELHFSSEAAQFLSYDKQDPSYAIFELTKALGKLKSLTLKYDLNVLMTTSTAPKSIVKALGGTYLHHISTNIFRLENCSTMLSFDIIKHENQEAKELRKYRNNLRKYAELKKPQMRRGIDRNLRILQEKSRRKRLTRQMMLKEFIKVEA